MNKFPLEVVPGRLWLSDRLTAKELCLEQGSGFGLRGTSSCTALDMGIKAVIAIGWNSQECHDGGPAKPAQILYAAGLHCLKLSYDDSDVVPLEAIEIAASFHRFFGPSLVHYNAGGNRSVMLIGMLAEICEDVDHRKAWKTIGHGPQGTEEMRQVPVRWRAAHP